VVEHLLSRRIPVIGLDDLSTGRLEFVAPFVRDRLFAFVRGDVRDEDAVAQLCRSERPGSLVHLAALHFIPAAIRDPALTMSLNVHGTHCLLRACRAAPVVRFWFASTGDVYRSAQRAHEECDEIAPLNVYGLSKWMGEQLLHREVESDPRRRAIIGRLFNLYGPRETNQHIVPEILSQVRSGSEVLWLGDLTSKRDLVPVADAAKAVVETLEQSTAGVSIVNVGTGVSVSMREVVDRIAELTGRPLRVEMDSSRLRPVERPHLQASVERLRAMIGWVPHGDLRRGLRDLLRQEGVIA
jgi:UDP-glucose 4-epimerase